MITLFSTRRSGAWAVTVREQAATEKAVRIRSDTEPNDLIRTVPRNANEFRKDLLRTREAQDATRIRAAGRRNGLISSAQRSTLQAARLRPRQALVRQSPRRAA